MACSDICDIEDNVVGFTRPEMYSEDLAGELDLLDMHVFVVHGSRDTWPEKVSMKEIYLSDVKNLILIYKEASLLPMLFYLLIFFYRNRLKRQIAVVLTCPKMSKS